MNQILESQFRGAIDRLKEDNFQEIIKIIFLKKYGLDFDVTKNCRDKGCDGILFKNTILAVYSPEKKELRSFKKKVDEDYKKYEQNWKKDYPNWMFVYNGEPTSQMLSHINEKGNVKNLCINKLIELIKELKWSDKRDLAKNKLGIAEEFITNDILQEIIEDLLKDQIEGIPKKTLPPDLVEKIKINYSNDDLDSIIAEHQEAMAMILKFERLLSAYKSEEIVLIRLRILDDYEKLAGDFKTRFNNLVSLISNKNGSDDYYMLHVKAILMYFFQVCLIGKGVENK